MSQGMSHSSAFAKIDCHCRSTAIAKKIEKRERERRMRWAQSDSMTYISEMRACDGRPKNDRSILGQKHMLAETLERYVGVPRLST